MLWSDDDKLIYKPEGTALSFDPLRVQNRLTVEFGGWRSLNDIQIARQSEDEVTRSNAELTAAENARKAFAIHGDDVTDSMALSLLDDFLGWLEKKGSKGNPPVTSPSNTDCPHCP